MWSGMSHRVDWKIIKDFRRTVVPTFHIQGAEEGSKFQWRTSLCIIRKISVASIRILSPSDELLSASHCLFHGVHYLVIISLFE